MSDRDEPDYDDEPRADGPTTEGVRIIGAQEAGTGEDSDRPRPPVDDLPMVRISSGDHEPPAGDRFGAVPVVRPGGSPDEDGGGHARLLDPEEESLDDEGFVLPHWTEPPTGQVPKVVIGDEQAEVEATPSSGPRWRDEGEREGHNDFEDLVEDAPALGSLDESDEDDFFDAPATAVGTSFQAEAGDVFDHDDEPEPLAPDEPSGQVAAVPAADAPVDEVDAADALAQHRADRPRRLPQRRPGGGDGGGDQPSGDRNLPVAAGVGVGLVVLGLLCFKLGGFTTMLLALVVVGMAALEYFTAVRSTRRFNPATLLGLVAVAGLLVSTYFYGLSAYPVVLALTVVCGLLWYLWVAPGERGVMSLGVTLLGVMWIGFLGSFATLFLGLGRSLQEAVPSLTSNPGIGVLLAAVVVSVSHDVGAYFVGRRFGRTPLSAASPNKTQEGLAGGVVTALVVTTVVVGFVGIDPIGSSKPQTFVFALLCALAAPLGDLCESFVKRDLKIKDMGSLLPGHGGVLDRFDSLLFVLPTAYFVTVLFDVWAKAAG
ncbi:MAG: phosphatidate cytidylyltransferase [Actinomycetes bacterium]